MPRVSLGLLLMAYAIGAASAAEPPIRRADLRASHLEAESFHFNVFISGKKVGWMQQSIGKREFEGEEAVAVEVEFMQKLLNDGEPLTTTSTDTEYFSAEPPHQFLGGSSKSAQNGFASVTQIVRSNGGDEQFTARIFAGSSERERELGALDYTLGDSLASMVWCEEMPAVGDSIRVRELDFTDLEIRPSTYTVTGLIDPAGEHAVEIGGLTGRYRMEYFDAVAKTRARFDVDASGRMLRGDIAGSVKLVLTDKADAEDLKAELDLFESSLIEIEYALGDPSDIREMVLEITGPQVQAINSSANQQAIFDPETKRVLLKVGRVHGKRSPVTEAERTEALEETSIYPTEDAEIIALVEQALGRATRPKARIKRLVDFVDSFIVDDYGNEPLSVNDIIDTQRGDCTEHSQLFVTMARAAGIPAREVSGFIYGEGSKFSFGGHAWCEVEVDGHWHPVDPTWGETMINATHIRISGERPSSEETELFMGDLEFRMRSTTDRHGRKRRFEISSETD